MKNPKTITKKILSLLLATVFLFMSAPLSRFVGVKLPEYFDVSINAEAVTSYTYNPDDAIAYAKEHYNDGKGLCAEFVSDCLKAGGFTAVYNTFARDLGRQLQEYGTKISCSGWSSSSCLTASMFSGELSKGDVIIWENATGSSSTGHAMLYSGKTNSKGQILIYAHNTAKCEEVIMPSSSATTVYAIHLTSVTSAPENPTNLRTTTGAKKFTSAESISFKWDAVSIATEYWVYMWKDGKQLYQTNMGNSTSFTSAPTSAGKYTLIVRAGNSVGYSGGVSYTFTVVENKIPDAPTGLTTTTGRTEFSTKESIGFVWDESERATEYWVYMWKDGKQLYQTNMGNNTAFTSAPTSAGKYTLIVRAGNTAGFGTDSSGFAFTVYNPDQTFTIAYNVNEGINTPTSQTKKYNEDITLSPTIPTRDGYTFLGWSTDKNATVPEYLAGDVYSENKDLTLYAVWEEIKVETGCVTGSVQTSGNDSDKIIFEFIYIDNEENVYTAEFDGDTNSYDLDSLEKGDYILKISKQNHATREYEITIGEEDVEVDVKLNLIGDINGDGKVTLLDYTQVLRHVKKTSALDDYEYNCADVNGDGRLMVTDYAKILKHVKKTEMLW